MANPDYDPSPVLRSGKRDWKKREKDGRAAAHQEDRCPDGVDRYFTDTNGSTMTARDEVSGRK